MYILKMSSRVGTDKKKWKENDEQKDIANQEQIDSYNFYGGLEKQNKSISGQSVFHIFFCYMLYGQMSI